MSNGHGIHKARIVPFAFKSMTSALLSSPARVAVTVTPPAQVADSVPPTEVDDCSVMSHFKSLQLPIGRPAMVDDPHAPMNADAGVEVAPDELEPLLDPLGAVGVKSFVVFSYEQPVTIADASRTPNPNTSTLVMCLFSVSGGRS